MLFGCKCVILIEGQRYDLSSGSNNLVATTSETLGAIVFSCTFAKWQIQLKIRAKS